jgi:hypothetical protein
VTTKTTKAVEAPPATFDLDAWLAGARLPESSVGICLNAALHAAVADASRALHEVPEKEAARRRQAQEALNDALTHLQAATVNVRLRATPHTAYNTLLAAHQPRKGVQVDEALGYNAAGFYPALLRKSIVSPEMSDEQWAAFSDALTDEQFDMLVNAAVRVNRAYYG